MLIAKLAAFALTTLVLATTVAAEPSKVRRLTEARKAAAVMPANPDPQRHMRVFGTALPPYAYADFCVRSPSECAPQRTIDDNRFVLTHQRWRELDDVNRGVNKAIEPITDAELYGVPDHWTLPSAKGDCEDYVLLKRQILVKRGWPISALLITVVRDEKGEGHAILTARTQQGDFILDNKNNDVKVWHRSPYQYVMRQSYLDPRVWMSLDQRDTTLSGALAGVFGFR